MNTWSRRIRDRRLRSGLTLAQAARRADTSAATWSRYENGWDRFELRTLRKIATALDCRLDVMFVPHPPSAGHPETDAALAARLRRLFWDQRLTGRHLAAHPIWVLERVLEYGNLDDVAALRMHWGRRTFLARVAECRFSSARTRAFWTQVLEREGIPCTKKFSRGAPFSS